MSDIFQAGMQDRAGRSDVLQPVGDLRPRLGGFIGAGDGRQRGGREAARQVQHGAHQLVEVRSESGLYQVRCLHLPPPPPRCSCFRACTLHSYAWGSCFFEAALLSLLRPSCLLSPGGVHSQVAPPLRPGQPNGDV